MRIESYAIGMDSDRTFSSNSTRKFGLVYSDNKASLGKESFANYLEDEEEETSPQASSDSDVKSEWDKFNNKINSVGYRSGLRGQIRDIEQVREQFVLYLWRMLFGAKKSQELQEHFGIEDMNTAAAQVETVQAKPVNVITIQGFNETHYTETESYSFRSAGQVQTSDGRTIDFNLNLNMSRSFEAYYLNEVDSSFTFCDPLVLNFSGDVASLTDQTFTFDLDMDGKEETISNLASGNGFLALDKNGDGIINDGSELFGAKSGDGFADLALYDEDHNGWIDENDSIFDKLKIWVKNPDGEDELMNLKSKNVGAIYLGNTNADYTMRNSLGDVNGVIRKMGMFLYEDGLAGTIAHLDIAN